MRAVKIGGLAKRELSAAAFLDLSRLVLQPLRARIRAVTHLTERKRLCRAPGSRLGFDRWLVTSLFQLLLGWIDADHLDAEMRGQ